MPGYKGMDDLLTSYQETRKLLVDLIRRGKQDGTSDNDMAALLSMERDVRFVYNLLGGNEEKAHPIMYVGSSAELDSFLGALGKSSYLMDFDKEEEDPMAELRESEEMALYEAMTQIFSNRELLCLMAYQRGMSLGKIATILGVKRSTAQSYIIRAKKKMGKCGSIGEFNDIWGDRMTKIG